MFNLHYSKMGSHLDVTFPSVFLWSLTTCARVEKNFKRKGSLPRDLVPSYLGTSMQNTPLHSPRLLSSVWVGDPRGGKSKREMHLYTSVSPKQAGSLPSQQLFFLRGETPDLLRLWTCLGRTCGFQWDVAQSPGPLSSMAWFWVQAPLLLTR